MQSYNVTAELSVPGTPARAEPLVARLADYHPAAARGDYGHLEITLTVPAETLQQAVTTAAALIGAGIIRVEALPADIFDERLGVQPLPELVGATEAAQVLGVSRQRVAQMVTEGKLPGRLVGKSLVIPRSALD